MKYRPPLASARVHLHPPQRRETAAEAGGAATMAQWLTLAGPRHLQTPRPLADWPVTGRRPAACAWRSARRTPESSAMRRRRRLRLVAPCWNWKLIGGEQSKSKAVMLEERKDGGFRDPGPRSGGGGGERVHVETTGSYRDSGDSRREATEEAGGVRCIFSSMMMIDALGGS